MSLSRADRKLAHQIAREVQEKLIAEMRREEAAANRPKYTTKPIDHPFARHFLSTQHSSLGAMKPFTVEELNAGEFPLLERIETPQVGGQFDMNQLAVAAVLTLNTMIRELAERDNRIQQLTERLDALERNQSVSYGTAEREGFVLQTLSDGYKK